METQEKILADEKLMKEVQQLKKTDPKAWQER